MTTPDFHIEPARCKNCGQPWHSTRRGPCETSCLAQTVILPRLTMPKTWWNNPKADADNA